jgi:hypothetical protein
MQDNNSYDEEIKYKNKYKELKRKYVSVFKEYQELNKEYKLLRKRYRNVVEENLTLKSLKEGSHSNNNKAS